MLGDTWIKPIHQRCTGPCTSIVHCCLRERCFWFAELMSFWHPVLLQVNCPWEAGASLSVGSCVHVCVWQRKNFSTWTYSTWVYACVCVCLHPQEGIRDTNRDFVRHLEPGLLDLICGAASLIGQLSLNCQCLFFEKRVVDMPLAPRILFSFLYLWI